MNDATVLTTRRMWILRAVALAPFVAAALAWWLDEGFRELASRSVRLLLARDEVGLRELGRELGPSAALFTTGLMIVQAIAAPIPAVLVTATNSWLFGPFVGAWLSIASATLAALLCFLLARAWGEPLVRRFVAPEKLARSEAFLARHGAATVLAARLMPFVPFDPISYAAGLTRMSPWTFAWTTFVGQIPAGFAYSYLAQELDRPLRAAALVGAALLSLTVVGWSAARALRGREVKPDSQA